jgi:hypothetical protein
VFAAFPELNTIHSYQFFDEQPSEEDDPTVLKLARDLPNLRRINVWPGARFSGVNRPVLILTQDEGRLKW